MFWVDPDEELIAILMTQLVQETLVGELSLTRRVRLHARIAEMLEGLYGPEAEAHAAELAHHFVQAEAVLGNNRLVRYCLVAGERALAAFGYEDALDHFQRALTAKESGPMDAETAAALFGLGRAQAATVERGQAQQAWDLMQRAFDYYVEDGDAAGAVAVVQQPLGIIPLIKGRADVVSRALELVQPDSLDAGRLLSHYGYSLWWEKRDYDGAHGAFGRAIAIAQREGDTALEALALAQSVVVGSLELRHEMVLESGPRAVELARRSNDLQAEVHARYAVASSLMATGDRDGASVHATAMLEAAESLREREYLFHARLRLGSLSRLEGDWQTAHAFLDRVLEADETSASALVGKALAYYEVGETEEGDTWINKRIELARDDSLLGLSLTLAVKVHLVSRITGIAGKLDMAEETAQAALATPESRPPGEMTQARTGLALLAIHRSDSEAAAEQYQTLRPGLLLSGIVMASDRLLGLLAQTMGKLDDAAVHFDDALAFCRKAGYRPELAWTCCDYADTLHEHDGDGDRERAVSMLDESMAISRDLGMRPLMERVLSRREHLTA